MAAYKALPGYVYNPLLKWPRNAECPCGSKKKFKVCCLHTVKPSVAEDVANRFNAVMRKAGYK